MIAATLLLLAVDPAGAWIPVGVTPTRLRVFVERASVTILGDRRTARVRIGTPGRIVGSIVVVFQDEEIDCRMRQWRMTAYDARDERGRTIRHADLPTASMLPAVAGTIGDAVVGTVCAI